MNVVFLMDPLEGVVFEKDTSFILMVGAQRRGHSVFYLPRDGISYCDGAMVFDVERVEPRLDPERPFVRLGRERLTQDAVDAVMVRTDPPFDHEYLMHTWLLDRLPERVAVVNRPSGIRTANEKLWALNFPQFIPRTVISRRLDVLREFLAEEPDVIAKPTDGFGGQSVFRLQRGGLNANVILESLTAGGTREIVMQRYIPAAETGDKRILLLNGEPLGAVLRVHGDDDHRNNFFAGGRPEPTELTQRDRDVIAALGPALRRLGLYFVGLDMLGDYLVEVNVTSPTCLQEMNRLGGLELEDHVIEFVEGLVGA